jgi:hypothetical protein
MFEEGVGLTLESVFFYFQDSSFNRDLRLPRPGQAEYRSLEWPFFTFVTTPLEGQDLVISLIFSQPCGTFRFTSAIMQALDVHLYRFHIEHKQRIEAADSWWAPENSLLTNTAQFDVTANDFP